MLHLSKLFKLKAEALDGRFVLRVHILELSLVDVHIEEDLEESTETSSCPLDGLELFEPELVDIVGIKLDKCQGALGYLVLDEVSLLL